MSDWRTLKAGRELDWYIAQQLGYRLSADPEYPDMFAYFMPSGEVIDQTRLMSEVGAKNALWGKWLPHYSTDADIAWSHLPINRHIRITRHTDRGGAAVGMPNEICVGIWNCDTEPSVVEGFGFGDTLALAICHALLYWKEHNS